MAKERQERKFSNAWRDLDVSPETAGESAERAARDAQRKRPRFPSEDARSKICPTLPEPLIDQIRAISAEQGYVDADGVGVVASPVVADLLRAGIEAYERGLLEPEEVVVEVERRLRMR